MKKNFSKFHCLTFFLKNLFIIQSKNNNFLKKIFWKISKKKFFFFLVFTMILEKKEKFDIIYCALIWIKNFISCEFGKFLPGSKVKFMIILIDFLASCPFRIYCQLFDIFIKIFGLKTVIIDEASFILKKLEKKLQLKTKTKIGKEFLAANLAIMEYLLFFCSDDFKLSMKKILMIIWRIIGGYKSIQYEGPYEACLVLIIKNFRFVFSTIFENINQKEFRSFMTSLICILPFEKIKKNFFDSVKLKLDEQIYTFVLFLSSKCEEEFTIYIPIFFKFVFLKDNLRNSKKTLSFLKWIFFLSNSINFKILFRFNFLSFILPFFILFLNKFNSVKCWKIIFPFRIISFSEKMCYRSRNNLSFKLINSLKFDIKKKIFIFFFQKLFLIENKINSHFHNFSLKWFVGFLKKNGNSINGIYLSLPKSNCRKIIVKYCELFFYTIQSYFFIDFADFISLYRFQLSIKNLFDTIFFIFNNLEKEKLKKIHSLIMLERCICVRGNDGEGKVIFFFEKKKIESFNFCMYKFLYDSVGKDKNREYLFKLLMRFSLILNEFVNFSEKKPTIHSFLYFDNFILKNSYNLSCRYIMELIFLDISFKKHIGEKFSEKIFKLGLSFLKLNLENWAPFVFDVFGYLIYYGKKNIIVLIQKNLFSFLFCGHVWKSNFLSKSILKFLRLTIDNRFSIFEKKEIIGLFTIGEINLLEFGETEELFFFLKSLIEKFNESGNFISHLIEIFLDYYFFNQNLKSTVFVIDFLILFIEKKGTSLIFKECEKLKKNLFLILLYCSVFSNFRRKISIFCTNNIIALLKTFFLKEILHSNNLFLEKLMERTIRKIIFDFKQINKTEQNKEQKNSRFCPLLPPYQFDYYFRLNGKIFIKNILEKLKNMSLFFPFRINWN